MTKDNKTVTNRQIFDKLDELNDDGEFIQEAVMDYLH